VRDSGNSRICGTCGESYSRGRLRCPECGEENDLFRDGIPVEALVPTKRVRVRGLWWLAAALLLVPVLVWLNAQLPVVPNAKQETVLWTPFFRIIRGQGPKRHPAELPLAILLLLAIFSGCKGAAELLSGIPCRVLVKLNPAHGWPELRGWLVLVTAILLAAAAMTAAAIVVKRFF
jgi:hypothetical protein